MSAQTYNVPSTTVEHGHRYDHERLLRRLFDEVYSNGDLSIMKDLIAPEFVGYSPATDDVYLGQNGAKLQVSKVRSAVFGLTIDVNEVRAADGEFEVHWTAQGRLERPFNGFEPSCSIGDAGEEPHGPPFSKTGITKGRISDGQIRELRMSTELV